MRGFLDRDILEIYDGSFFVVVGNVHPSDRVIAYPKYIKGSGGFWFKEDISYKRVFKYYSAKEVFEACKNLYPHYLIYDKVFDATMFEVPHNDIKKHYKPEDRLREIISNPSDKLLQLLSDLVTLLTEVSNIKYDDIGVTGSILAGIHNVEYSDIDLVIYGLENALTIRELLRESLDNRKFGFSRLRGEVLLEYASRIAEVHPLSMREAIHMYKAIFWNRGLFRGKFFSIHPVPKPNEVKEKYGDKMYRGLGIVEITADVVDNSESLFTPSKYRIENVNIVNGPKVEDIFEVVSYEGLYMDIADIGDRIKVLGKLEKVYDKRKGSQYFRVVVGSVEAEGKDYIRVVEKK